MIEIYAQSVAGVWFGVASEKEEILATNFGLGEKRTLEGLKGSFSRDAEVRVVGKPSAFAKRVISLLKNAYDGKAVSTNFILGMKKLSEHNRKVLYAVSLIPFGYVSSYGAVAKATGSSPRAVGRVMATNPLAPIVPCHRVVGSDFTLVGYGGGLNNKLRFLKRERRGYNSEKEISIDGRKLRISPVELALKKAEKK